MPKTLLIVHASTTGGTTQMARAAEQAALAATRREDLIVRRQHATHTEPRNVLEADGYLFATPEHLAAMAGLMKAFFDRCYYPVLDQINGRPYASLICAGSDGSGAARQIERIATGWRLKAVAEPLIVCTHAQTTEAILAPKHLSEAATAPCRDIGAALATGLVMGVF